MLLSIDTSTAYASIAVSQDDELLAELTWRVESRHSAELLTRVDGLLRAQGLTPASLDAIAVALGPGSFNGVRAGVATAKGLALALEVPLAGVPTLDVVAWGARLAPVEVWALLDAGRGEVYAAVYDTAGHAPESWRPRAIVSEDGGEPVAYHILTPEALAALATSGATLLGELRPAVHATVALALGERARLDAEPEPRRAYALARLAQARLRMGLGGDATSLEPLYLRRPAITSSARPDIMALRGDADRVARSGEEGERLAL